jgi:hypothetical protein
MTQGGVDLKRSARTPSFGEELGNEIYTKNGELDLNLRSESIAAVNPIFG